MRLRLREVREAQWLTQQELGDRAGISRVSLNAIETGKAVPRFSTVRKLAAALGVSPDELVVREDREQDRGAVTAKTAAALDPSPGAVTPERSSVSHRSRCGNPEHRASLLLRLRVWC